MFCTRRWLSSLIMFTASLTGWGSVRGDDYDVIVICHEDLREPLQRWTNHRGNEGLTIGFCQPQVDAKSTANHVRQLAGDATRYVLIVGDTPPVQKSDASVPGNPFWTPTFYRPSPVTRQYGSTDSYPTDWPYADFDGDGQSDASVGRLPVTAPDQLVGLVERIIAYETSDDFGSWRQCLQLTAGVGGFGSLVDNAIEAVTRTVLTSALPADVKPRIAYASPGHAFCPTEAPFQECVLKRYREGSRFWIYAGHGSVDRLDLLTRAPDDADGIRAADSTRTWQAESLLGAESVSLLRSEHSRPTIGLLLACYAGAFDAAVPCLSERMLLTAGGPIAMISASRLTMPYGNAKFGLSLLEAVYEPPVNASAALEASDRTQTPADQASGNQASAKQRIGDAMLTAQRKLQSDKSETTMQVMLDGVAALISPAGNDLAQERREHAGLYQLLGDPTLRLQPAQSLSMKANVSNASNSDPTKLVRVEFRSPLSGTITLSVDRPLGSSTSQTRSEATANDPHDCTLSETTQSVRADHPVKTTIRLPIDYDGPIIIRGLVESETGWATGSAKAYVRP